MRETPLRLHRRQIIGAVPAAIVGAAVARPAYAAPAGKLMVALGADVLTLDPSVNSSAVGLNAFKNVYDQLTDITIDGSVAPQLATAWTASADARTWTFTLRTDARFHDDSPVTIDDVVWSFTKILADQTSPVRSYLSTVVAVDKVADDKIRFTLNAPFAPFPRQVSLISIIPRAAYERLGAARFSVAPIGSGPFKVVTWVKDDRLELAANASYWGGGPHVASVIFRPVPSESARVAGLQSGELDIVPLLPPASVPRLQSTAGLQVSKVRNNRVVYLGFDTTNPLLANVKLRQAVDMAIDRTAITQKLLQGLGTPEGQLVASMTFGYDPSVKPTQYDPGRARQLLKESAYTGAKLPFQYPNNRFVLATEVAEAIAGYMQAIGLNVDLQGMEYSAFFPLWAANKLRSIHMFAFGPSIMDAELPLETLYEAHAHGYWPDADVDRLVKEQRATSNSAKRQELISQIWRASQQAVPYVVLYGEIQAYGIRAGIDWSPRPDERLLFKDAALTAVK